MTVGTINQGYPLTNVLPELTDVLTQQKVIFDPEMIMFDSSTPPDIMSGISYPRDNVNAADNLGNSSTANIGEMVNRRNNFVHFLKKN